MKTPIENYLKITVGIIITVIVIVTIYKSLSWERPMPTLWVNGHEYKTPLCIATREGDTVTKYSFESAKKPPKITSGDISQGITCE